MKYHGEQDLDTSYEINSNTSSLIGYDFIPPEKMLVFEEYLVFDAFGMIGSIGGALGLCIGFSFSGVIASIVEFIQKRI